MDSFKTYLKKGSSIAASLLAIALAVLSSGSITFTVWWHYFLAIIILFIVYGFLLSGVAFINFVYFKFFQRANLKVNYKEEVIELGAYAKLLYEKNQLYEHVDVEEYRVILRDEMLALLDMSEKKTEFIKHIATVPSIRKGPDSLKDNLIQDYEKFFAVIRGQLIL